MSSAACRTTRPEHRQPSGDRSPVARPARDDRAPPRPAVQLPPSVPCATPDTARPRRLQDDRSQQLIVGRRQGHRRRRPQPRRQVGQGDEPMSRRQDRRQQQEAATFAHQIVEMEQGPLRRAIRALDDDRGRGSGHIRQIGHALALEIGAIDHGSTRACGPDPGEMRLAATGRAAHRQRRCRPVGPAIDPGQRLPVAAGQDKILAGIGRRRQREFEGELIGHWPLSRHCRHGRSRSRGNARSGGARARRSPPPSAPRSGCRRSRTARRLPEGQT